MNRQYALIHIDGKDLTTYLIALYTVAVCTTPLHSESVLWHHFTQWVCVMTPFYTVSVCYDTILHSECVLWHHFTQWVCAMTPFYTVSVCYDTIVHSECVVWHNFYTVSVCYDTILHSECVVWHHFYTMSMCYDTILHHEYVVWHHCTLGVCGMTPLYTMSMWYDTIVHHEYVVYDIYPVKSTMVRMGWLYHATCLMMWSVLTRPGPSWRHPYYWAGLIASASLTPSSTSPGCSQQLSTHTQHQAIYSSTFWGQSNIKQTFI